MKAIPLWQPWASLWLSPRKVHETQGWSTDVRGAIAVHATLRMEKNPDPELEKILDAEFGYNWRNELPTGALIGTVELVDCVPTIKPGSLVTWDTPIRRVAADGLTNAASGDDLLCGDWSDGRFALKRSAFTVFKMPIRWTGQQGKFFEVPDDVIGAAV